MKKNTIHRNICLLKVYSFFDGCWPISALLVIFFNTITTNVDYAGE